MKVVITKELDDLWGTPEVLAGMSDEQIINLVCEDVTEFFDRAEWKIDRTTEK